MKALKITLILILIIGIVFVGLLTYVAFNGKAMLLSQIEKNTGIKVQVDSLRVMLPDTIVAEGIKLSQTAKIKRLEVTPSLIGFFSGKVIFNKLVIDSPSFTLTRKQDDTIDFGVTLPKQTGKPAVIYINKLIISAGELTFIDRGLTGQPPFILKLGDLKADVFRPSLLQLFRMQFNASGRLLSQDGSEVGQVKLSGWADPVNWDTDSKLEVKNGKLLYFAPYYDQYFSRELKTGDVAVTVTAVSKKNDMVADCHIGLSNVTFLEEGQPQEGQSVDFSNIAFMTFDSMLGPDGNMAIDFSIKTKMNNPKFENVNFKGTFMKNRIEASFRKSPQQNMEDFKKVGEQFEEIGKQFKKIFSSK
ncbi:MAG TPA: DUF748 domain-containing protein [Candidatus Omnitrophota bacterium]|nr:DUF748 domain-containing protein [Candidatus Omnitrophota bacterium]